MAIRRKDSFLWGKAPIKLPPEARRQGEAHEFELLDDIQKLRLEINRVMPEIHSPELKEQNKNVARNRKFLRGKKKFNMDSKKKLYTSIRSEPFKIPEDDGNDLTLTFFNPDREGWLLKIGEMKKLTPHDKPGLQDRTWSS
ncbi:cytohesin-2-like [Neolamprologus brichardi]|uniref:cytohesin-2-like n=1 Tax=Neolamprologus brichardi TaxID=32507 RepID=UPI00164378EE|nr:cytohesin-2-like [Neolamprologus brichardi]